MTPLAWVVTHFFKSTWSLQADTLSEEGFGSGRRGYHGEDATRGPEPPRRPGAGARLGRKENAGDWVDLPKGAKGRTPRAFLWLCVF